jgi:aspartate carbamoyltransferase catalytic subunit
MVMHPGPVNRGIEISAEVADGEHSSILRQVENGVFMRSAIIEALIA